MWGMARFLEDEANMSSPFNLLWYALILILSINRGTGNHSPPADPLLIPHLLKVAGKYRKDSMDNESDEDQGGWE